MNTRQSVKIRHRGDHGALYSVCTWSMVPVVFRAGQVRANRILRANVACKFCVLRRHVLAAYTKLLLCLPQVYLPRRSAEGLRQRGAWRRAHLKQGLPTMAKPPPSPLPAVTNLSDCPAGNGNEMWADQTSGSFIIFVTVPALVA